MTFSLFFWRKKPQAVSLQPPPQPAEASPATPGMPFVRSQGQPSAHPRLQRMAELLQQLPQPPNMAPQPLGQPQVTNPSGAPQPEFKLPPAHPAPTPTMQSPLPVAPEWQPPTMQTPTAETHGVEQHEMHAAHASQKLSELRAQVSQFEASQRAPTAPAMSPVIAPAPTHQEPVEFHTVEQPVIHAQPQPAYAQSQQVIMQTVAAEKPFIDVTPATPTRQEAPRVVVIEPTVVEQRELVEPDFAQRATNAFYAADGSVFWTTGEFGDALIHMSDDTFGHHVSPSHNDFANWIDGCFTGDTRMVGTLIRGLDRQGMIKLFLRLQRPPAPRIPILHADEPHFDEKQPAVWDWNPATTPIKSSVLHELEDALKAAELTATHDVGAAREAFIHVRTRVWSELSDDERGSILPKMRAAYDRLRAYH